MKPQSNGFEQHYFFYATLCLALENNCGTAPLTNSVFLNHVGFTKPYIMDISLLLLNAWLWYVHGTDLGFSFIYRNR